MADDNKLRSYRSNDPYRRAGEPSRPTEQASDPLAELARLIGRSDPFAELGRSAPRPGQQRGQQPGQQAPQYSARTSAPDDWPHSPPQQEQQFSERYDDQRAGDQRYDDQRYAGQQYSDQQYPDQRYAADDRPGRQAREPGYDQDYDPNYRPSHGHGSSQDRYQDRYQERADDRDAYRQQAGHRYEEGDAEPQSSQYGRHYDPRYDQPPYDEQPGQQYADDQVEDDRARGGRDDGSDHYVEDDVELEPHEDAMYDDAPRGRRHGGLVTALALVGCAMLGTAGAYAYRSYYGPPGSVQPPPIITADNTTPTKIVPAAAGDPQSSKAIQDQFAAASKEQIVTQQEEPVALRELGTQQTPRVVLQAPVAPTVGTPGTPSAAGGEPKKVRTVTIRPDGTDQAGRSVGPLPATTQAPTRSAATPPTLPAPRAATPPAPPARAGGPISLDPQPGEGAPTPPAPRARTAAAPAVDTTASTGGFMVQLSSQRSENEAQSSFRSLQQKFPNELGDRQPVIRRADLGSKGVVYRAMVGPFTSAQEAQQFCSSYKAAGGQCLVPNNN